jgi:MYXO-CTERM domain-containing protein
MQHRWTATSQLQQGNILMRTFTPLAAAALALSPAVAFAQGTTDTTGTLDATAAPVAPAEDDEFPWGLLGLLGLAGLAGLKRRDDHRVDTRRTA